METIKETKEMLRFILSLGMSFDKAFADKKIDFNDVGYFVNALLMSADAFKDIKKIPAELKDLDNAELEELTKYIKDEFDLGNDNIERLIETGLGIGVQIYQLILEIKNLKKDESNE